MLNRPDQEPLKPVRDIPINEWFRPFLNYDQTPYIVDRQDYRIKEFYVNTAGLGLWQISTNWEDGELRDEANLPTYPRESQVLIVDHSKEIPTFRGQVIKFQNEFETPLVSLSIYRPEAKGFYDALLEGRPVAAPTYSVALQLPSGTVLQNNFSDISDWKNGTYKFSNVFVPETTFILSQLQMKVDRV